MKADRDDTRALLPEQCFAFMASVPIGRVVYTDQALPAVMPMNFVLDRDMVTIHTGSGSALSAAIRNAVVAFQTDDFDPVTMTGWSVTITGRARLVDDPREAAHLMRLPLRPWVHAMNGQYIRIPCWNVTGQRLGAVGNAAARDKAG